MAVPLGALRAAVAVIAMIGVAAAGPVADRACSKPGLDSFPFCNASLPVAARIADLISR